MKEFVSGASVRLAELEDLFVDMKARVRYPKNFLFELRSKIQPRKYNCSRQSMINRFYIFSSLIEYASFSAKIQQLAKATNFSECSIFTYHQWVKLEQKMIAFGEKERRKKKSQSNIKR